MPPLAHAAVLSSIDPATRARPDAELLQRFAQNGDQAAFTLLVARHANLVYSVALRRLSGDAHLAQDVTQSVFNDTARKARALATHRILSSWLYTSTCYTAAKAVRGEQRRRKRERESSIMQDVLNHSEADAEWNRLRPVLDQAMQELKAEDREALLLRFFEAKNFSEVGRHLRLSENAARMRVDRALEKLRAKLAPFGITSTAAALGGTLGLHAVSAAPASLVSLVTTAAVSSTAATGGLSLLQWLALHKAVAVSSAALLTVTTAGLHREQRKQAGLEQELAALGNPSVLEAGLHKEVEALARRATEIASLRRDDSELERLKNEATALRSFLQGVRTDTPLPKLQHTPAAPQSPFDPRELDRKPALKQQPRPKYPIELRQAGVSGQATVSFVVDPNGTVTDVKVVDATHKGFEYAASQAVQSWTFEPGMKEGRPVSARMTVPMVFSLTAPKSDPAWF